MRSSDLKTFLKKFYFFAGFNNLFSSKDLEEEKR